MTRHSLEEARELTKEEVLEWLRGKVESLEFELKVFKTILSFLESGQQPLLGEKVEEVKVGRRRVARVFIGEGYVRLSYDTPVVLPNEIKEYLNSVREDIRTLQARSGAEGDLVNLVIRERPDGAVVEVRLENLQSTVEVIKAKAALKYAVEATYQLLKAKEKEFEELEV